MISVKILKDSLHPNGGRLVTFELTYPRFIHSEFMTHRCFSRNAASSRAIPIERMVEAVTTNAAWPERWGKKAKGMQDGGELREEIAVDIKLALRHLLKAATDTIEIADDLGLAKQIANRYIEPWAHITVIATTEQSGLNNFFNLRADPAAQPEFQVLAYRMLDAFMKSETEPLVIGQWHTPMDEGLTGYSLNECLQICTGRIARVSYLTHDGQRDPLQDSHLTQRLIKAGHWSPFEHCARAVNTAGRGNFGLRWWQYRNDFTNENQKKADYAYLMLKKPTWITL